MRWMARAGCAACQFGGMFGGREGCQPAALQCARPRYRSLERAVQKTMRHPLGIETHRMRLLLVALAAAWCAGCVTNGIAFLPDYAANAEASAPLVCSDADQCRAYRARALEWIRAHPDTRFEVLTSEGPQVFEPERDPMGRAVPQSYRVQFVAQEGAAQEVTFDNTCSPMICPPSWYPLAVQFKRHVRGGPAPGFGG